MTVALALGASAQQTYVVSVGLNNYSDGKNPLPCSRNDARSLAKFYKAYNDADVFMLLDDNATRNHVLRVLSSQFAKSTEADEIVFIYSGHGFDGGLACWKDPVYVSEVQQIMRQSKARRKLIFLNSCHSGSFKDENHRRGGGDYKSSDSDVMLYMSSRTDEYTWENSDMTHSYFVDWLLRGLRGNADRNGDRKVTARELFNYVNSGVQRDTNNEQHPQMYGKFADDMVVVYVK